MVAQWFYPKDLKELIAKLEAEGNLRREPLKHMNRSIFVVFFMTIVISCILFFEGLLVGLTAFISLSIINLFVVRFQFKYIKAFIYGEKQKAIIKDFKIQEFRRVIPNRDIHCERLFDGRKIVIPAILYSRIEDYGIQVGDEVTLYYSDTPAMYAALDIDLFKQDFCLRKDLMEKN